MININKNDDTPADAVYDKKVKVQVYSLISSLKTYHPTLHLTPGHWTCSFV